MCRGCEWVVADTCALYDENTLTVGLLDMSFFSVCETIYGCFVTSTSSANLSNYFALTGYPCTDDVLWPLLRARGTLPCW